MTRTLTLLAAIHQGPVARLEDICERYLQVGYPEARRRAVLNALPFPAFRLTESQKSPLVVRIEDLAAHIDRQAEAASKDWANSQV